MSARTVTVMPLGGQQAKGPGSYVDFVLPMGTLIPSSISVSGYLTT